MSIVADHVKLVMVEVCDRLGKRHAARLGDEWSPPPGEVGVYPKRQSRQTVRFHATQPDFMPEGPRRITPDATKLDPWRFEKFNMLPCRAHHICSENSAQLPDEGVYRNGRQSTPTFTNFPITRPCVHNGPACPVLANEKFNDVLGGNRGYGLQG